MGLYNYLGALAGEKCEIDTRLPDARSCREASASPALFRSPSLSRSLAAILVPQLTALLPDP
jgi:hypothetical protein